MTEQELITLRENQVKLSIFSKTDVDFDEETHTYTLKESGVQLKSVTQLLTEKGVSPKYDNVDEALIKRSAYYGKTVHKEIEEWIKNGTVGITQEFKSFVKWLKAFPELIVVGSEVIVHNNYLGGCIDLILYDAVNLCYIIVDFKTTSVVHTYSVSWQLSLYEHLITGHNEPLENKDTELSCYHFDNSGELTEKFIPKQYKDNVQELATGGNLPSVAFDEITLKAVKLALQKYEEAENTLAMAKEYLDSFKDKMLSVMEEQGVKSFDSEYFKVTYVAPVTKKTIDTKALKEKYPLIANELQKESTTKASLRITLKKQDNEKE